MHDNNLTNIHSHYMEKKSNNFWLAVFVILAILSFSFSVAGHTQTVASDSCATLSDRYPEIASFDEGDFYWIRHYPLPAYYAVGEDSVQTCDVPLVMSFKGIAKGGRVYTVIEDLGEVYFDTADVTDCPALTLKWKEAEYQPYSCLWNALEDALGFYPKNEYERQIQGAIIQKVIKEMFDVHLTEKDPTCMTVSDIQAVMVSYRKAKEQQ